MIQIFGTTKCKATRAAQRFFADRRIQVQFIDLKVKGLSKGELASVAQAVGGMQALYATGSARAKERGLRHNLLDETRLAELLERDPLLLVTPIVRDGRRAAVGAAEATWRSFADASKS